MAQYFFCSKVELPSKEAQQLSLSDAIKYGDFSAHLPYELVDTGTDGGNGKPPKDPLTIYFVFDIDGAGDTITIKTTVRNLLKSTLYLHSSFDGKLVLDETSIHILSTFRDSLVKESVWLDRVIKRQLSKDRRERSIQD